MPSTPILKARGLYSFQNQLSEIPEGSLAQADNVVIDRDGVLEPRRGFKLYGSTMSAGAPGTAIAKQLLEYKGRILRHFNSTLQFDSDGSGTFSSFSGNYSEVESGLRIKGLEANGNFYFTTSDGIKKIPALTASDLSTSSGYIINSGGIKALDAVLTLGTSTPGILPDTYTVAYRQVWGITDINNNLILGSPGQYNQITNTSGGALNVVIDFTIPQGVTVNHVYQIYRTKTSPVTSPGDEMILAFEGNPTAAEIAAGSISYEDVTTDDFLEDKFLYTNPNSGEGILQSNEPPPKANDLALYKNILFYANTTTKYRLDLSLLSTENLVNNVSKLYITDGTTTTTYTFTTGAENAGTQKIHYDTGGTPAQNVDSTARSLVRIINKQMSEIVYAYYVSTESGVPGLILLESRNLSAPQFFLLTDSAATGAEFSPDLSPLKTITSNTLANPTVVTSTAHGLTTGDVIVIAGSNSVPTIDGPRTVTVIGANTFSIPVNVTTAGTAGVWQKKADTAKADDEVSPNRLYYSKFQQPEAVPIVNYFDVGPKAQPIQRIIGLRDSLYILKTDGIYRLTGDNVNNFQISLFDNSCVIKAPDSVSVLNNQIYVATSEFISVIGDTGVSVISRPIQNLLSKVFTYNNFSTKTFGFSSNTDKSYFFFTMTNSSDTTATQCFRYNTFTQCWTRWPLSKSCGINSVNNKLYLGASDLNYIEVERKDLTRLDYADREYAANIISGSITGASLTVSSTDNINVGDALVQDQYVTLSQFNNLLRKLDLDVQVADGDYFSLLQAMAGQDVRDSLTALATKLDNDTGVNDNTYLASIAGFTNTFADTQAAFNTIIGKLNVDTGVADSNYLPSTGTVTYEDRVLNVNSNANKIALAFALPLVAGPVTVYSRIKSEIAYAPHFFGDPSMFKQVREGTVIFDKNNFSAAIIAYGSDLSPSYEEISVNGLGPGWFGSAVFGQDFFGGDGNAAPIRTLIPKQKQRCRFLTTKFKHSNAFEIFSLFGVSYAYETFSTKAYR